MQEIIIASQNVCSQEFRIRFRSGQEVDFCIGNSRRFYEKGIIEELFFVDGFRSSFSRVVKKKNVFIFFSSDGNKCKMETRHVGCKHKNGLIENRFIVI